MFRRKRYAAQGSDMPWWPDGAGPNGTDPREQPHAGQYGYDEHGYHDDPGYGPARPNRPGPGAGPGGPPPLTAHDPFGGWPAFAGDPDAGQGGWTAFAGSPDAGPGGWGSAAADAGPAGWGSPPGAGPRGAGAPVAEPPPIDPSDIEPVEHDPAYPLLTHPVGSQRFQPDLEAAAVPTPRGAADRPGNGRTRRQRRDSVAVEDATTWLPAVTDPADLDPAEAAALAGAFAADYLSWDQDDPGRRGQVLSQYLPPDVDGDPSLLGWSGKGRQRADFALPGTVQADGEGRVMVDVRVRVTPFRRVGASARTASTGGELEVAGVPAAAPAPTAKGWRSLDSHWVRMSVPVLRDDGRLVVDTWDEQTGSPDDDSDSEGLDGMGLDGMGLDGAGEPADPTTAEDEPEDLAAAAAGAAPGTPAGDASGKTAGDASATGVQTTGGVPVKTARDAAVKAAGGSR